MRLSADTKSLSLTTAKPASLFGDVAQRALRLLQIRAPLALIELLAGVHDARQAARIDGEERGVGAIRRERQLAHVAEEQSISAVTRGQSEVGILLVDQESRGGSAKRPP